MTLIQFTEVETLEEGQRFYSFPDKILGQFHAFQVTAESTQILEQKKDDAGYLGLFSAFDEGIWKNLMHYLSPCDLFKMVVATRNMNGLQPLNKLRNFFVYLKNGDAYRTYQNTMVNFGYMNQFNRLFQPEVLECKVPLRSLQIKTKASLGGMIPFLSSIAGDLKVVHYDSFPKSVRDMIGGVRSALPNPLPDLQGLLRLNLNGTIIDRNLLEGYIRKAPNLMHLELEGCVFDETWGGYWKDRLQETWAQRGFPEDISLENLESLNLRCSTINPFSLYTLLKITKKLQRLDISSTESLADMDCSVLAADSLPSLKSFVQRGLGFVWSSDQLMAFMSAAPNLKKLDLFACKVDDQFLSGLQPQSFGAVEELNLSNLTINNDIINILKAAPCLKKLSLDYTNLNLTIDPEAYVFPGIHTLHVYSSTIKWNDLSILLSMMPHLIELDIGECSGLYEIDQSITFKQMLALEEIVCNTVEMGYVSLDFLLRIAPNLKRFPLNFDSEFDEDGSVISPFEQDITTYCRLAARGHKVIQDELERHMMERPDRKDFIERILAQEIKTFKDWQSAQETSHKRQVEDGEEPSSKRLKDSDE